MKILAVVLLIDEYDKPIIDFLTEIEKAEINQRILRQFFGPLKGLLKVLGVPPGPFGAMPWRKGAFSWGRGSGYPVAGAPYYPSRGAISYGLRMCYI